MTGSSTRKQFFSKSALRKSVLFIHLWLGLIIGFYFAILGVTGSVLVFREDIETTQIMPERDFVAPPTDESRLLPLSQIIDQLRLQFPDATDVEFAFLNPPPRPEGAPLFRLTANKQALSTTVNPYTGQVIKRYEQQTTWLSWIDDLHTDLLFQDTGKLVNGYAGLLSCLLLASGIWLWWPATIRQIKVRSTIKKGAGIQRIIADLHNVMGLYPFLLLLVVTFTGSVIVFYKPIQKVVVSLVGPIITPKVPPILVPDTGKTLPIETLMAIAKKSAPHAHFVFVMYPTKKDQAFYAYLRSETGILPDSRIYLDPYTGKPVQIGTEYTDPTAKKIMRSASGIHFGRWGGLSIKILYFLLGLIPLGLFVTGILMYLRKRRSLLAQKRRKAGLKTESV